MLAKANYNLKLTPFKVYQNIKKIINATKFNTLELQENLEYSGIITKYFKQTRDNVNSLLLICKLWCY